MQHFWKNAARQSIETQVIRISTVYFDFEDFWDSNAVPLGPQGKITVGHEVARVESGESRLNKANLAGSDRGRLLISESTRGKKQPMSSNTRMLLLSSNSGNEDVGPYFKTGQVVDVGEDSIKASPELRRLLEQLDDDDGA